VIVLRAFAYLVGFVVLLALALAGLAAAIFSIQGDGGTLTLTRLAEILGLPEARDAVGDFLGRLEAPGPVAVLALLGGLAAMAVGLALIAGALAPARGRELALGDRDGGRLAVRRGPLRDAAELLGGQARGVTGVRARVRPRPRGRLRVRADRRRDADDGEVRAAVEERLRPLAEPFGLGTDVEVRSGEGRRVS
jgi:hypothetical protein